MDIQFGMPTLMEHLDLSQSATLCKELGLTFVELNMNLPQYQIKEISNIDKLKEIAKRHSIYYTIHLEENLNICDFNLAVGKAYSETVKNTIQIAKKLNTPVINMHMHPGVYFTLPDEKIYLFEKYKDTYIEKMKSFREMCEQEIGDYAINICIENTDGYHSFQKEGIELLLESKVFSLTWDIGHSHIAGRGDENFIMEHENRLKHFHIHDATNKTNHLTLGSGEIDLIQKLSIANLNNCRCVIETKTIESLRNSIMWLEKNL